MTSRIRNLASLWQWRVRLSSRQVRMQTALDRVKKAKKVDVIEPPQFTRGGFLYDAGA